MANENQTKATENTESSIISKIKWFFQKSDKNWWEQKNARLTRAFTLTRKDSIIWVVVALLALWWAIFYWKVVLDEYSEINNRTDELKDLSTYNASPDVDVLSPYTEGETEWNINWMITINNKIQEKLDERETFKQQQKSYYEVLLQNIYLPSLNVWKDPYTKDFNLSILWQKYLERDKFQDLYLIQHWSDFVKYVWNDADYNTIDSIVIWDKVMVEDSNYFYTPITISFSSPNKRSFLLLVNKLSMTSNTSNISLLNEFFFYLLNSIKEKKSEEINSLMKENWELFSSSSNWEFTKDFSELTGDELSTYKDRVIWYNLYHWINQDKKEEKITPLIDDEVIAKAIANSALCTDDSELDWECLYDFREKYRDLPYLAYKIWLENQTNRTDWLLEFLQDLPPAIAITNFGFEKYSNSSFLNNKEEEYQWEVKFNAYGRDISPEELEEASQMLWKLCFWNTTEQTITPELAVNRVDETIRLYGSESKYQNVSSLWELKELFTDIQEEYEELTNYDKMIKLFEIWRMMNDANLCNK